MARPGLELVKGLEDEVAAAQRELSVSSSALDGLQAEKQQLLAEVQSARSQLEQRPEVDPGQQAQLAEAVRYSESLKQLLSQTTAWQEGVLPTVDQAMQIVGQYAAPEALGSARDLPGKVQALAAALPTLKSVLDATLLERDQAIQQLQISRTQRSQTTSPHVPHTMSNKKDEDDAHDLEAAMLSGGVGGFEPIAGMVRGTQLPPAAMKGCIDVATQLDRATIALHNNGKARAAVIVYLALQHVLFLIFMLT